MRDSDRPFFSFVTVTLNNLEGVERSYRSVAAQHCRDFEWIVIDGASRDGTPAWLANLAPQGHGFSYLSAPDSGLYHAMNRGLDRAQGRYVLFLNAGDTLGDADTLARLAADIEGAGAPDFIYGDAYEMRADGGRFYKAAKDICALKGGMITHHQAMLYKRSTIGALRYDLRYRLAGDYDFTARFVARAKRHLRMRYPVCVFDAGGLSHIHARAARVEEFQIRTALGLCSVLQAQFIYLRQTVALWVRRLCPALFYRYTAL